MSVHRKSILHAGRRVASVALVIAGAALLPGTAFPAAEPKPAIAEPARNAVQEMAKSLSAQQISLHLRTIREYQDAEGHPLHIFHEGTVLVRRPDHLRVDIKGDDGALTFGYDGKDVTIYAASLKKYTTLPATGDLETMLKAAHERLGFEFPLADFLVASPDKAFLSGVAYGTLVNTITIDDTPARHLFFAQPPGIDLELWLADGANTVPRRLIVTYRSLPGEPRFIAEMSDWKIGGAARPPIINRLWS